MLAQGRSASQKQQEKDAIPIWEWIGAVIGLVLVAGVIGFLLFEASARGPIAPGCEALGDFSD